jgi:hypothetical protein
MRSILLLLAAIAASPAGLAAARQAPAAAVDRAACDQALASPAAEPVFGCANALNLRLMVADPRDLERGAALAPASGDAAFAAAERHRLGEVKPLGASSQPSAPAAPGSGPAAEGR